MKIINTSQAMPKPGRYVLAWMEGAKIPMRAMWAAQHTLPLGDDADPEWGEYSEEKDEYFCPAGWYEMNQHEEQHWGVDGNVVAWCELPRLDAGAAPAAAAPRGEYPQLPEGVMCIEQVGGEVIGRPTDYGFKHGRGIVHGAELFTSEQLRAYFDLGRQSAPAAPALEAPAAPAGWKLVPAKPTDAMLGAAQKAWLADPLRRSSTLYVAALAAAPQAPAAPSTWAGPVRELMGHLSDVLGDEAFAKIDTTRWNAVSALIGGAPAAPAAPAVDASPLLAPETELDAVVRDAEQIIRDAEHYRFIKRHRLILSGGTDTFGWPIAPFGDECDRYIAQELATERAAQAKEGGA